MNRFNEMFHRIVCSSHYEKALRFASPLKDHFGISHFWYFKITLSGHYSYFGTHVAWSEFCYENSLLNHFPELRHPDTLQGGIKLYKSHANSRFKYVLKTAWEKFRVNFNIDILNKTHDGLEGFGFASQFLDDGEDERILNSLPILTHFKNQFLASNKNLLYLLKDNQIDLGANFGAKFFEKPKILALPVRKEHFMEKLGLKAYLTLTSRERDIAKYLAHGFPAPFIALQLKLSFRTV